MRQEFGRRKGLGESATNPVFIGEFFQSDVPDPMTALCEFFQEESIPIGLLKHRLYFKKMAKKLGKGDWKLYMVRAVQTKDAANDHTRMCK